MICLSSGSFDMYGFCGISKLLCMHAASGATEPGMDG